MTVNTVMRLRSRDSWDPQQARQGSLSERVRQALAEEPYRRLVHGLGRLCRDLDLVACLQQCARRSPRRIEHLREQHGESLERWLFGVALGCAGLGLYSQSLLLLDAVPGLAGGGRGRREFLEAVIGHELEGRSRKVDEAQG
jgi:hypothetical protein